MQRRTSPRLGMVSQLHGISVCADDISYHVPTELAVERDGTRKLREELATSLREKTCAQRELHSLNSDNARLRQQLANAQKDLETEQLQTKALNDRLEEEERCSKDAAQDLATARDGELATRYLCVRRRCI